AAGRPGAVVTGSRPGRDGRGGPRPAEGREGGVRQEGSPPRKRRRPGDLSGAPPRHAPARHGRAAGGDDEGGGGAGERQGEEPRAPRPPRARRRHRRHGPGQPRGGMVGLGLFNPPTPRQDGVVPLVSGEARMYVCGVTVYDLCHIGHARSAIVFDVMRRYLRFRNYKVTFIKNYTDVDDRIIRRANEEGVPASTISERYIAEYQKDM